MSDESIYIGVSSPTSLGRIWVAVSERGLVAISMLDDRNAFIDELEERHRTTVILDERRTEAYTLQVQEYLAGARERFDLPIDWSVMTPFQEKALRATCGISRGETRTYGELAGLVGNPKASRAVGRAQATNPIPIVIPCHRVISSDGKLHGYSGHGGLKTKAWLLELESSKI